MSSVNIKIANEEEWNTVYPMGEMEATRAGRCLNPPLKFNVTGLKEGTLYEPRVYFQRSDKKFSFGSKGFWAEWAAGEEKVPLQYVTLGPMDSASFDFSTLTITTNKDTTKPRQLAFQSHYAYQPKFVLTCVTDESEVYELTDESLRFVVVTKATPRLKKLRQELKKLSKSNKRGRDAEDGEQGAPEAKKRRTDQEVVTIDYPNSFEDPSVVHVEDNLDYQQSEDYQLFGNYQEPTLEFDSPNQEQFQRMDDYLEVPDGYEDYEGPLVFGEQELEEYVDLEDQEEIRPDSRGGSDEQEGEPHLDMDIWNQRYLRLQYVVFFNSFPPIQSTSVFKRKNFHSLSISRISPINRRSLVPINEKISYHLLNSK